MKSIKCDICGTMVKAETDDEVVEKISSHIEETHKDVASKTKSMSAEDQEKVKDKYRARIKNFE